MNMLRSYHGQSDMDKSKLSFLYDRNGNPKPIDSNIDYKTRNKKANLTSLPIPEGRDWNHGNLTNMLDRHGPVEALINVDGGWEHNIVLVGADHDNVIYHDPAEGPNSTMSMHAFNNNFCWERYKSALTAYGG